MITNSLNESLTARARLAVPTVNGHAISKDRHVFGESIIGFAAQPINPVLQRFECTDDERTAPINALEVPTSVETFQRFAVDGNVGKFWHELVDSGGARKCWIGTAPEIITPCPRRLP